METVLHSGYFVKYYINGNSCIIKFPDARSRENWLIDWALENHSSESWIEILFDGDLKWTELEVLEGE